MNFPNFFKGQILAALILVAGLLLSIGFYIVFLPRDNTATTSDKLPIEEKKETIVLKFVGDIMLDRGVEWQIGKSGNNDWRFPFLKIANPLREADILFGNLESVISDKGYKVGSIYSFRADPKAIEGLTYSGFDVVSVANNHAFDYTREAFVDSILRLKENDIKYVGGGIDDKEAYDPLIIEAKGTRIAFLGFTNLGSMNWEAKENQAGVAWLNEKSLEAGINKAEQIADIIIVSFHFGDEYVTHSNPQQQSISRMAIDFGADLIVGHHPHVSQEVERYKEGYIAYSLGNFVFDQSFSEETMKGLLLNVIVEDKKIKEVKDVSIQINDSFQPEIGGHQ